MNCRSRLQASDLGYLYLRAREFGLQIGKNAIYFAEIGNVHSSRGLMDKASDFGSGDCGFESHRGRLFLFSQNYFLIS